MHQDADGVWVAELDCGHNQHIRHRPPFQVRPWVLTEESRAEHIGSARDCPLCDRVPARPRPDREAGGESACFAHLLCPECGAVLDGGDHMPGCSRR